MGIRGVALVWFENYLAGRTQFVDIDGNRSEALSIDISVIQGSILGRIHVILTTSTRQPLFSLSCLQTTLPGLVKAKTCGT